MPSITVDLIFLSTVFILSTVVAFNVGYFVCYTRSKKQEKAGPNKTSVIKKKIVLKSKATKSQVKTTDIKTEDKIDVKPVPSSVISGMEDVKNYEPTIEKGINVIHSIVGTAKAMYNEYDLQRSWHLVSNNSHINFFSSKEKDDGILIRCTSFLRNVPPSSIVKWMLDNDVITGLEGVASRSEIIRRLEINEETQEHVVVRRLMCKAGTLMASKRDFILITSISAINPNEHDSSKSNNSTTAAAAAAAGGTCSGYIIATRSVPEDFIAPQRGSKTGGFIRGLVFGCGYIMSAEKDAEGHIGTKISYAAHVDMLGSRSTRTTTAYCNMLISSTEHLLAVIGTKCVSSSAPVVVQTHVQQATLTRRNSVAFTNTSIDLSPDDREEIIAVAKAALRRLRKYHGTVNNTTSGSGGSGSNVSIAALTADSNKHQKWEVFHDQDGVALKKLKYDVDDNANATPSLGIISATCSIDAPTSVVRNLLIDHPDSIDALLEGRSVLNHLSESTYVQWLAYGAMYPLGAKDFLLVTREEEFASDCPGFIVASTSIDDICEMADEVLTEYGAGGATGAANKKQKSEYNRSSLKLAGYVGVSNVHGGTDLTLILDLEFPFDIPSFVLQLLCQYGLTETMRRIKSASESAVMRVRRDSKVSVSSETEAATAPSPSPVPQTKAAGAIAVTAVDLTIPDIRDSDVSETVDSDDGEGDVEIPNHTTAELVHNTHNNHHDTHRSSLDNHTTPSSATTTVETDYYSSSGYSSTAVSPTPTTTTGTDPVPSAGSSTDTTPPPTTTAAAAPTAAKHVKNTTAEKALSKLRAYMQLPGCNSKLCDVEWTLKINKPTIAVYGGGSPSNTWGAIKAVTKMKGDATKILKLLTDDNRIGEYDEMFDFFKFIANVDERSNIRRVCFKAVWPTAPRDFLICTTHQVQSDGSILIATVSVPDSHFAQQKGYVRGHIQISGYYIQPYCEGVTMAPTDGSSDFTPAPGECRLTLTAHSELGGTLPVSVINMLSTNAPVKIIGSISEIMKKC